MEVKIQIPDNCELVKEGDVYKIKEFSYPKTWEEYCKMYPNVKNEYYINFNSQPTITSGESRQFICDKNLLSSKEEAEAFLALMQLRQLRKAWVGDWKQEKSGTAAVIVYNINEDKIIVDYGTTCMSRPYLSQLN